MVAHLRPETHFSRPPKTEFSRGKPLNSLSQGERDNPLHVRFFSVFFVCGG